MYIHERDNWTDFRWDASEVSLLQEKVFRKQGLLYGRLSSLGFDSKLRAMAENLTYDVVYSSEIEGIQLNVEQVRSSIARKLGIENVKDTAPSHYVDSVVGGVCVNVSCNLPEKPFVINISTRQIIRIINSFIFLFFISTPLL